LIILLSTIITSNCWSSFFSTKTWFLEFWIRSWFWSINYWFFIEWDRTLTTWWSLWSVYWFVAITWRLTESWICSWFGFWFWSIYRFIIAKWNGTLSTWWSLRSINWFIVIIWWLTESWICSWFWFWSINRFVIITKWNWTFATWWSLWSVNWSKGLFLTNSFFFRIVWILFFCFWFVANNTFLSNWFFSWLSCFY